MLYKPSALLNVDTQTGSKLGDKVVRGV